MSPHHPARTAHRCAVTGTAALTAALALCTPASAHAEVQSDTARALAENVTLAFTSEAESATAGFTRVRVVLPDDIAPGDVTLADAPQGWKLKSTDDGYTVAGPALGTGVDAEHSIKVRRLPDAGQLVFKTVETYDDGEVSRWIELPADGTEPEQPAPVLKLQPAASGTASPAPSSSTSAPAGASLTPGTSGETAADTPPAETAAVTQDDASSTGLLTGSVVAVLLVLGSGTWWLARRRASSGTE
ncbi:DUF1775 domain-containing protein [Streptomyces europaeiscabiei]|uniref:DUF1775 domain-containing protein n=1 Tax=Streptomyces europaeiscabiei TaxID=146819 RepID=UPI002E12E31D|nr:YcnI family protein [Streptomyces europaeiscabiei]